MKSDPPGLELMRDRTPDGLCPFCLDPIPPAKSGHKKRKHCGDPACQTAYTRCYQRDRRAGKLVRAQRVGAPARAGRGTVRGSSWFVRNRKPANSGESLTRPGAVRGARR